MKPLKFAAALAVSQSVAAMAGPPAATPAPAPTDVRVISSPTAPVFTKEATAEPLYASSVGNLEAPGPGIRSASLVASITVPAGRLAALEQTSLACTSSAGQLIYPAISILRNGTFVATVYLTPLKAASQTVAVGSEALALSVKAGDVANLYALRESSPAAGQCFGTLAGRML